MYLAKLTIERFRGISHFEWTPPIGLLALVGAGDSCKTTILDAIELVLSPRWNPLVSDNDIFGADTDSDALIDATVGDLPIALMSDRKFGLNLRGMNSEGDIHDEPQDGDDLVLTIRFALDGDMEPTWSVVNDRLEEGRPISARDRAEIGMAQLGGAPNSHFTWSRGSAIMAATSSEDDVARILAEAQRSMRTAVRSVTLSDLDIAVEKAGIAAIRMGAGKVAEELEAALNAEFVNSRGSGLSLHSRGIPLDRSGLGTRRLVALGLQQIAVRSGAILLVDEVEAGLEPFRLRHLLRILQEFANGEPAGPALTKGQVLLTTHSPVVIEELDARSVHVVRRDSEGVVEIRKVPEQLQDVLRAVPESFLGRRIVVCEGKTELGLACAVEGQWSSKHGGRSLAHAGAVLTLGNGQQTGSRAQAFSTLGFPVSVLADSDNPLDPSAEALSADGIAVFLWADGVASETRLSIDLPWDGFLELYRLAEGHRSSQSIRDAVSSRFETPPSTGEEPQSWADGGLEEDRIRTAFAEAAIKGAWFKRVDYGIEIGELVVRYWDDMLESNLVDTLSALADWIYDDDWT